MCLLRPTIFMSRPNWGWNKKNADVKRFFFFLFVCQTNVALVSPLLRLENNHCHIEESEYVLKKAHKYSELIILYEKKGLHQKGTSLKRTTTQSQVLSTRHGFGFRFRFIPTGQYSPYNFFATCIQYSISSKSIPKYTLGHLMSSNLFSVDDI